MPVELRSPTGRREAWTLNTRRARTRGIAASLALWLAACGGADASARGRTRLVVTGSSTMAPLMAAIAERYERLRAEVRIDVQSGGSSRGVADVRRGSADLGMVSRAPGPAERGLHAVMLARDGICPIVHRSKNVPNLTRGMLRAIYRGRIRSWQALGGPDRPIVVVHKAAGRATHDVFLRWVGLTDREVRADVVVGENQHAIKTVAGEPDALAYVSIGAARAEEEHGAPIRLVALEGAPPSLESLTRGDYPMARPLYLVMREPPRGVLADFLDFALSADTHDLVRAYSFASPAR